MEPRGDDPLVLRYAARRGLLDELDVQLARRREPADRTRALAQAAFERLWSRATALRDKTLWRLLNEPAACASGGRSRSTSRISTSPVAVPSSKERTAISTICTGRPAPAPAPPPGRRATVTTGFLTERRASPSRAPAAVDLCPHTSLARLSYRRAEERFRDATAG